jgi:hypothetical protein
MMAALALGHSGLGAGVVGFGEFAILVFLKCAGALLRGETSRRLDSDELQPRGNLAVDVNRHLGLEARRVEQR